MYEYVAKSEYAPIKRELERIIKRAQNDMKRKHNMAFQFQLIGSGTHHLVTRIRGGNSGYDFDYNLIITPPDAGQRYDAGAVKQYFMNAFQAAVKGTGFSFPKDSTSVITIKMVDKINKKLCYSCDFAIIYFDTQNDPNSYYYLRNNKKQNVYEFVFRPLKSNTEEKATAILKINGWNFVRNEYLRLKNINEGNKKHSFSLYTEAVNNVFHQKFS